MTNPTNGNTLHKKKIRINDRSITVQISGEGRSAIVFIHGSSMSSSIWLPQLTDPHLQQQYLLIAIDLPGHGDSAWWEKPDSYGLKELAVTMTQVIDALHLHTVLLVGLSYGTTIIGEILSPLMNCKGIMLVSPCIINNEFLPSYFMMPHPLGHIMVASDPPENELRDFIHDNTADTEVAERYYYSYKKTDPAFRQQIGNVMMNGEWTDELGNIQKWNVPVCVVFGKEEKLVRTDYLDKYPALWNGRTYHIENAIHVLNEENTLAFNRLLNDFASAAFK